MPALDLEDIFGQGGPLQRALPDFRVRREQLRMAERVAGALAGRETLVVEAGTGTGKTFAYLVPALLSGARVLISTGTRTLQDQLFSKDLPLVGAALGRPARVALLKGRANYLCRHRLALSSEAGAQLSMVDGGERSPARAGRTMLARIARWARTTRSGDLAEVPRPVRLAPGMARRSPRRARTVSACAVPRSLVATWRSRGARRSRPTSSSSTITCCSPISRSRRTASVTCSDRPTR